MSNSRDIVRRKYYPENEGFLFVPDFSEKGFKKSLIKRTTLQFDILDAIVRKLVSTSADARTSNLHDEYLDAKKEWRFRVTQRPTSTRIHYQIEDNAIIFLRYYGEGEHDDGL